MDINIIKTKMYEYGRRIGLSEQFGEYPIVNESCNVFPEGSSIYADDEWHYVSMERGEERIHCQSGDLNKVLYYVFKPITASLAEKYTVKNRVKGMDFRRLFFEKQLELLGTINKEYQKVREEEIETILKKAPYQDL
jgi:hypothetical protein